MIPRTTFSRDPSLRVSTFIRRAGPLGPGGTPHLPDGTARPAFPYRPASARSPGDFGKISPCLFQSLTARLDLSRRRGGAEAPYSSAPHASSTWRVV